MNRITRHVRRMFRSGLFALVLSALAMFAVPVGAAESAPEVSSAFPTSGATGVALDTDILITFSEPVNAIGAWFDIVGSASGVHTAGVTGDGTTFTLDPDTDFELGELVAVTILSAQISDQDTDDPPDNMAADLRFSFVSGSTVVPEPGTLALLGIALAGLGFSRRKRVV